MNQNKYQWEIKTIKGWYLNLNSGGALWGQTQAPTDMGCWRRKSWEVRVSGGDLSRIRKHLQRSARVDLDQRYADGQAVASWEGEGHYCQGGWCAGSGRTNGCLPHAILGLYFSDSHRWGIPETAIRNSNSSSDDSWWDCCDDGVQFSSSWLRECYRHPGTAGWDHPIDCATRFGRHWLLNKLLPPSPL